jgi:hypothetical protein
MPGFLSRYESEERVDFGDGYYVTIRALSGYEREVVNDKRVTVAASARTTGGTDMPQDVAVDTKIDQPGYKVELLHQGILDWNLTDRNEQPLPLHPDQDRIASIKRLPDVVFDELVDRLEKVGSRSKDEQESFRS